MKILSTLIPVLLIAGCNQTTIKTDKNGVAVLCDEQIKLIHYNY